MLHFDSSFQRLPPVFFSHVKPTPLTRPRMLAVSRACEEMLKLSLNEADLLSWLNGELRLPGDQRISTRYAGHQFGVWAGQLGDGRAISLGELLVDGARWEIQTKGSGLTPFSRMGDGKAVMRSSIREFLASEHMHALGIPTTRALALVAGDDPVERETIEKSALVARVFPSNLRFGHFEYAFHFDEPEALKSLVRYTQDHFFPETKTIPEMLALISERTAKLIAEWMAVGFCHGVMNTDNMSILGITIDYGPFGFMEDFDANLICNHSDPHGRYKYSNQPSVALWNLDRLLWTFSSMVAREELQSVFESFLPNYDRFYLSAFRKKLGLHTEQTTDAELVRSLLQLMHQNSLDFTYTFRNLQTSLDAYPGLAKNPEWQTWQGSYRERRALENLDDHEWQRRMLAANPKYVLKNYLAQDIIASVEKGDETLMHRLYEVLTSPFAEHPGFHHYSLPTPLDKKDIIVSCSS